MNLNCKTAIVCHDAGGAELVSNYVKNNKGKYFYVLSGPAIKIFKKNISNKIKVLDLAEAEKKTKKLLCGSSFVSKLERKAIIKFKKKKKETTVFFDHWTHYKKRLIYKKSIILPEKIWVSDKYAFSLCKSNFPKTKIVLKKNFYIENIKNEIKYKKYKNVITTKKYNNILYVSEPISEFKNKIKNFNYKNSLEYKTFKFFTNNIEILKMNKLKIIFRIHPLEKISKYKWLFGLGLNIEFSKKKSLISDVLQSKIVVGRQTMALVVALAAKKKVISCIPPNEQRCCLPYKGIKELRDMI